MSKKEIGRILNKRTLFVYFFTYMLFLFVSNKETSIIGVFGGFSVSVNSGLDVVKIMKWNLCVLPPVAVSILFMDEELGTFGFYTILRTKGLKQWWCIRWATIAIANIIYVLVGIVLSLVREKDKGYSGEIYGLFIIVFFVHTFVMSVISVLTFILCKSLNISMLLFGGVEIFMTVTGSLYPKASPYLLPFWGMIKNKNFLFQNPTIHILITVGISIGIVLTLIIYTIKCLKSETVANYIKSR